MFIKSRIRDLHLWRAAIINSNIRYWDTFNLTDLVSCKRGVIVDIRMTAKNLDSSLNLLLNIFTRGGRAWFYNIFYRRKRYVINLKTMLYIQSTKPFRLPYGLTFPSWFPGRLSNRKFVKIRSAVMKKKLFFHKYSALRKSFRFYRPGGYRGYIRRRKRRYSTPPWARFDRYYRPRGKSRRRGVSLRRIAFHFKVFNSRTRFKRRRYRRRYNRRLASRRRYSRRYKALFRKHNLPYKRPKRRFKKYKSRRREYKSWLYFTRSASSFFYKPDLGRSFSLYSKFVPVKYSKIKLNKLVPGTPEEPTDLPITNMPTTSFRRKEKKKKKMFKLQFKPFNNAQGDDFRFLIKDHLSKISSKANRYLKSKESLFFPTARLYKLFLFRRFRYRVKKLVRRYANRKNRRRFRYRFIRKKIKKMFRKVRRKKYRLRFKLQDKYFRWANKINVLSTKLLRLVGAPSLTFRGFSALIVDIRYHEPVKRRLVTRYKRKLNRFFSNSDSNIHFIINKLTKPLKRVRPTDFKYFLFRLRRIRRFQTLRRRPRLGKAIRGEKTFFRRRKASKRVLRGRSTLKRKALLTVFFNPPMRLTTHMKNFYFNNSILKYLRRTRLITGKYIKFSRFYKIKNRPNLRRKKSKKLVSIAQATNRKFTPLNKVSTYKRKLDKSKRFRFVHTTKLPNFLRQKSLRRLVHSSKKASRLVDKIKLHAKPTLLYPTLIFVSRLTRLTSSILNEARVTGVISSYLSTGEASPAFAVYNVLINDYTRSLSQLEPIVKSLFFISKTNSLLSKTRMFTPRITVAIQQWKS